MYFKIYLNYKYSSIIIIAKIILILNNIYIKLINIKYKIINNK